MTAGDLAEMHYSITECSQKAGRIIKGGMLESIADRPKMAANGRPVYGTVFLQAAAIMEGIVRFHPFVDGNKRTALASALYCLEINGYAYAVPLSAVRFVLDVARNPDMPIEDIAAWLERNSAPKGDESAVRDTIGSDYTALKGAQDPDGMVGHWLALDVHPGHGISAKEAMQALGCQLECGPQE